MEPDFLDRRTAVRFPLNSEKALSVSELIETRLLDISMGGVSFRSSKGFEVNERITIGGDLLSFGVTVLESIPIPKKILKDDPWAAFPHRVRCRYANEEDLDDIKILMALVLEEEEDIGQII